MLELLKDTPRLWSLRAGRIFVVTDLHGDWETYCRCRDRFLALHARGQADALLFTGDLIHRDPGEGEDASLTILRDLFDLREVFGSAILYLLGNHEMPHIYSSGLARGEVEYTTPFERALSEQGMREPVRRLFASLPFFLRTAGGVSLSHAGASHSTAHAQAAQALFHWNHQALLENAEKLIESEDTAHLRQSYAQLRGMVSYAALARLQLGLEDPQNPHYDDPLRGFMVSLTPAYKLLWSALFTRCEREYEARYPEVLAGTLRQFSQGFEPQRVLVSGHMLTKGGAQPVTDQHLRLASGTHALPPESARCLLLDAAQPVQSVSDLLPGLLPVFPQ